MNHCAYCVHRKECKLSETKQWCDSYYEDREAVQEHFRILSTEPIDYEALNNV